MNVLADDDPRHGTTNGYHNLKCRCSRCRQAHTDNFREITQLRKLKTQANGGIAPGNRKHGSESTYSNWGCQCAPCKAAHAAVSKRNRIIRMKRKREAS